MVLGKKSNPVSRRLRFVVAGATAVLQLHLFFVVELHNHNGQAEPVAGQSKTSVQSAQWQNSSAPDPICSACRISHQGALQLPGVSRLATRDSVAGNVRPPEALKFYQRFRTELSSRGPPLSS